MPNTDYENFIICPHCGYKYEESWRIFAERRRILQEGLADMVCKQCKGMFIVKIDEVKVYSTRKKE